MQENNFNVVIGTENYNAVIGETAKIDVGQAINYIKSGEADIAKAVDDGIDEFNANAIAKKSLVNALVGVAEEHANHANIWAEGNDTQVQSLGGEHSAKVWSEILAQTQVDWAETDISKATYIQNKPTAVSTFANDADYQTASDVATAIEGKQATLVSGTNIKTINGTSVLGSGDITIQSAPDIDGISIDTNSDDELQTIGVIDQNDSTAAIKTWTGTKAQYDAITTKDNSTFYTCTDTHEIYLGTVLVADKSSASGNSLLDFKWSDHELDEMSWLRADTFSWQSGSVYSSAYEHLVADIEDKELQSETIGAITIQYYLADDGHKIAPAGEESNVASLFTTTGVAWYYILDTDNTRFKLPRSTYNKYSKQLPVKGNGMTVGWTNGTVNFGTAQFYGTSGGQRKNLYGTQVGTTGGASDSDVGGKSFGITTDAGKSGIIASSVSDSDMKLYFYVGEYAQSAIEQTAGLNVELFNGKADIDLTNATANASSTAKETVVGWVTPDYTAGISIDRTTLLAGYTAPCSGFIMGYYNPASGSHPIYVNNAVVADSDTYVGSLSILLMNGDVIKFSAMDATTNDVIFYPLKGVSNA